MDLSTIINQSLWLFYLLPIQHYIQTKGLSKWPLLRILWSISLGFLYLRFIAILFHFDINYQYIKVQNFIMRPFHLSLAYIACLYFIVKLVLIKRQMSTKNFYTKQIAKEFKQDIEPYKDLYNTTKIYIIVTLFMVGFITGSTYLVIK